MIGLAKKSAKRLTRERLKRAHAQAHRCAPPRARMPSHILHYSPLFPDNFCNAKVVAASSSSPPRRTVARARLTRWCKTVQNQPAPDALFGNAFKSSYVCMYFVQGVSFKNAFSTTVQSAQRQREAHGACTSELRVVRRHRCSSRTSVHHRRRRRGRGHLLRQTRQLQKDQTEPAVSLPSTMSRIVNVRHYILVIVVL